MAIMEAELRLALEWAQTVLMMMLVTLEPLPHHYEQLVRIGLKQQQLAEIAAAAQELQAMGWVIQQLPHQQMILAETCLDKKTWHQKAH